ncbi:cycloheximide resistance protein [Nemania abortiva]|nr:cycloheximide resistance protein [Nemania abortiva]
MSAGMVDDPENPHNWFTLRKTLVFAEIILMTFSTCIGSSVVTTAEPTFVNTFGLSQQASSLSLSVYVLKYGIGPLFFVPLFVYTLSLALFLDISIAAALGLLGSPVHATGGAPASDLFGFRELYYGLSAWPCAAFAGPVVGPVISAFAVEQATWRWTMYELPILSGFTFIVMVCFLPETNADTILLCRARRLRRLSGNNTFRSESEKKQGKYPYFESLPLVGIHGFSLWTLGVVFTALLTACAIGVTVYLDLAYLIYEPYTIKMELASQMFGLTARSDINWAVPAPGVLIYPASQFVLGGVIFFYLATSYLRYAASLFVESTFFRSALGTGAAHFSQPLSSNLDITRGCGVLARLLVACFFGIAAL